MPTDLFQQIFGTSGGVDSLQVLDVLRSVGWALVLSLLVGYVYKITHAGPSYSQTTVHTMIIMAICVALMMRIIGTNIARAFSLVGALSIIRFRKMPVLSCALIAMPRLLSPLGRECLAQFLQSCGPLFPASAPTGRASSKSSSDRSVSSCRSS